MQRVRCEAERQSLLRPHDLRRDQESATLSSCQPPCCIFGDQQFADMACGIGQRGRHRVPAIENHRPVRARLAVAPGRPAGRFSAFFEGFTAAAAERWFSVAIAHRPACVTGSGLWQFGRPLDGAVFGGFAVG